ncbi:MAG: DUF3071 domain-containing protein [Nocardioidaceae bacterium]|nr:DUF3071 domain-containing protein [Nocardioidaceae bacterium]
MRKLTLVGLSGDGQEVVLVDDAGSEFVTPADDRLRAALRGDRARLGQLEIEMQSALRPRDIQALIRAGESPETVAATAQVSVDKIMAYCVPVLAERQHIADLAQRSHVRRKSADGPARRLADVVVERLRGRGVDPESCQWDARRREDGRWVVEVSYISGERERQGKFVFDAAGRYSVADDDEARWLTGERQSTTKGPQPREGAQPNERRLAAVPDDDDLLSLSGVEAESRVFDAEGTDDLTAVVRAVHEADADPADTAEGAAATPAAQPMSSRNDADGADDADGAPRATDEAVRAPRETDESVRAPRETEPTPTARRRRTGKRASVPTWDEIMFGKGKQD